MRGFPTIIYTGEIQAHSWCKWAITRVKKKNNSTNIRIIGDTGSGKSWSALAMAEIMADMMGMVIEESDIYFSISDVIRKVSSTNPPKPGSIFFIDEQQVEGSSGEYNSLRGKAYTAFFSTVRSKRYIIISTMPFADMIIKKVRRFFHVEIETISINSHEQTVKTKPRLLDYHKHKDYTYRKRLVIGVRNPKTNKMTYKKSTFWNIPKPSKHLIDIYEHKKAEFQRETYGQLVKDIDRYERKHHPKEEEQINVGVGAKKPLTAFQKDLLAMLEENPQITNNEIVVIMEKKGYNCSHAKISLNVGFMRKKGYYVINRQKKLRGESSKQYVAN